MSESVIQPSADPALREALDRLGGVSARTVPVGMPAAGGDASTIQAAELPAPSPARRPPWLAASASLVLWGGGQILNRQRPLALLFILLELLGLSVAWCLHRTWESWVWLAQVFFVEELTLKTWVAVAGLLLPAIGILGMAQAYLRAERSVAAHGGAPFPGPSPIPALASALVPGWGQFLNAQLGKAVLFLSCWSFGLYVVSVSRFDPGMWTRIDPSGVPIAGLHLSAGSLLAASLAALGWVLAVYDAFLTARVRSTGR